MAKISCQNEVNHIGKQSTRDQAAITRLRFRFSGDSESNQDVGRSVQNLLNSEWMII